MAQFNINFEGVGDGFKLAGEGTQICKVKSIELTDGKKAKQLVWTLVIGTGPDKGTTVLHRTSLSPEALFNLRNTIIACGFDVPKTAFKVNTDLYVGKVIGITVVHKPYKNSAGEDKIGANVKEVFRVKKTESGWVKDGGADDAKDDLDIGSSSANMNDEVEDIDVGEDDDI